MLIEIPDIDVLSSVIIAFLGGLGGLFVYYKLRSLIKPKEIFDASQKERLEYYERQLIDMKIRLDSLEIQDSGNKLVDQNLELKQFLEKLAKNEVRENPTDIISKPEVVPNETKMVSRMPNLDHNNATDYVLKLITNKAMTSRDIQITLKRSREHTSRLMKKLFEDGYVKRNTDSKPYSYSISEKGKERIGVLESNLPIT